ncbi:16S rRNA pseudouridine(516) synthase [Pseudomonas luteola]|uniref:16S rRNA pseudouridine(516) synthase n=1 Tax=Pseudomonas luteola TaxID=47886 RepID=UPI001EF5764F|nr:16S rRNA pseudouridine(516) synthase [Pseudomonas luteola]MCG7373740.1 16S rRNA pseudouridine(516) synthase [Pseudomonas luteola]
MRLDRFISNRPTLNRLDARVHLAHGHVRINGVPVRDGRYEVRFFDRVELLDELLQPGKAARYFMLHKPVGYVSATQHPDHPTVIDLLNEQDKDDLHLSGRLDLNTSGLMLITNDGLWSRRLTLPGSKLPKVYYVETANPILPEYVSTFAAGLYFKFEDLTTLPAHLDILSERSARLTLIEGRYHQVKRMFGHFRNQVLYLHRERIGPIVLDPALAPGEYRPLTAAEIACGVPA